VQARLLREQIVLRDFNEANSSEFSNLREKRGI
jgi:hypothetical protein